MTKQTQEHAAVSAVWQLLLKCWDGITLHAARNFSGNTFSSSKPWGDNIPLVLDPGTRPDPKAGKEGKFRQWDSTEQGLQSLSHPSTLLRSRSSPKHNWWWQDKLTCRISQATSPAWRYMKSSRWWSAWHLQGDIWKWWWKMQQRSLCLHRLLIWKYNFKSQKRKLKMCPGVLKTQTQGQRKRKEKYWIQKKNSH